MIRTILNGAYLALFLASILPAADAPPATPVAAANAQTASPAARPVFSVYASFGCSRSFRKVGSYPNINDARRVAEEERKTKQVWIATGNDQNAWHLLPKLHSHLQLEGCSVYAGGCRGGLQLAKRVSTMKEAEAAAAQFKQETQAVEIVYHLK